MLLMYIGRVRPVGGGGAGYPSPQILAGQFQPKGHIWPTTVLLHPPPPPDFRPSFSHNTYLCK